MDKHIHILYAALHTSITMPYVTIVKIIASWQLCLLCATQSSLRSDILAILDERSSAELPLSLTALKKALSKLRSTDYSKTAEKNHLKKELNACVKTGRLINVKRSYYSRQWVTISVSCLHVYTHNACTNHLTTALSYQIVNERPLVDSVIQIISVPAVQRKIIHFMDTAQKRSVCQMWRQLADQQQTSLSFYGKYTTEDLFLQSARPALEQVVLIYFKSDVNAAIEGLPNLLSLTLWGGSNTLPTSLSAGVCSKLHTLKFVYKQLSFIDFEALSQMGACPNIHTLEMSRNTAGDGLDILFETGVFPNLTDVNLSWNKIGLSNEMLIALLRNYPNLVTLDVSECGQLTDEAFEPLSNGFDCLTTLKIINVNKVSGDALGFISSGCPNLEFIDVSGSSGINPNALGILASGCSSIQTLRARSFKHIDVEVVNSLVQGCPNITCLYADWDMLHDESVQILVKLVHLKELFTGSSSISGRAMKGIMTELNLESLTFRGEMPTANRCPHLTSLHLPNFDPETDVDLVQLCPSLRELFVYKISLEFIHTLSNCHELRSLSVVYIETEELFNAMVDGCPNLIMFAVHGGSDDITDECVQRLGVGCSKLATLSLSECCMLTDVSMQVLANCRHLTFLDVSGCVGLTKDTIEIIMKSDAFLNLRRLNISRCFKINKAMISDLSIGCPELKLHGGQMWCSDTWDSVHALVAGDASTLWY